MYVQLSNLIFKHTKPNLLFFYSHGKYVKWYIKMVYEILWYIKWYM